MICLTCGAELAPGSRFCSSCGAGVTDPGAATVMLATAQRQDHLLIQLRQELAKDYEVEKELGRGGMAVVYRAQEIELRRVVALKVLPPGAGTSATAARFRREARLAASLDHPNIIPIYRVGQAAGTYYFAMKYVEGRALDAIIEEQGPLPVPVVIQILRATASALAFAHERQTVHRDIKDANILVDRDGRVLVSDFGIARAIQETTLTASGSVLGTPHFMSPEQCAGQKVGPQSDQYSLGVLAFQMLTGQVPFDADSVITIIQHHYFTPVPDVHAVRQGVPEELLAVVNRALAKDATQRYATTRDMVRALEAVPFSLEDKAQSEELLRELACGEPIPRVRTGSLPPLADARTSGAAMLAASVPTVPTEPRISAPWNNPAPARARIWAAAALAVTLIGLGGGYLAHLRAGAAAAADSLAAPSGARPAAGTSAATPPPAAPAPAARQARSQPTAPARVKPAASRSPAPHLAATRSQLSAREEAAAAPTPAGTGLLRVLTQPPAAQITVDGKTIGQGSAFDVELTAGRHRLRITAPGFVAYDTTITVDPGVTLNLGTQTLRAESGP